MENENPSASGKARAAARLLRDVTLEFPTGDGRTGHALARLFCESDAVLDSNSIVVAIVEAPAGAGGYNLTHYTCAIAQKLCDQERLSPDRLLYLAHDGDYANRLADWSILLGPLATFAYTVMVEDGALDREAFYLVAFDWVAGALANPRLTPLSRLEVEELVGGDFSRDALYAPVFPAKAKK